MTLVEKRRETESPLCIQSTSHQNTIVTAAELNSRYPLVDDIAPWPKKMDWQSSNFWHKKLYGKARFDIQMFTTVKESYPATAWVCTVVFKYLLRWRRGLIKERATGRRMTWAWRENGPIDNWPTKKPRHYSSCVFKILNDSQKKKAMKTSSRRNVWPRLFLSTCIYTTQTEQIGCQKLNKKPYI